MTRELTDRTETFDYEISGKCGCKQDVICVINSSVSGWMDKKRYYYPGDTTAWNIFRCVNCGFPIRENFKPNS